LVLLCFFLLAAILVGIWFGQLFTPINPPAYIKADSLQFLKDVIGLNESEIVSSDYCPQNDVLGSNGPLLVMAYDLESSGETVRVHFFYCQNNSTYTREPTFFTLLCDKMFYPPYPGDNVLNWTKGFLERYQRYQSDSAYISAIRETLNTIEHIAPMNTTCGDVSLHIKIRQFTEQDIYTTIKFTPANLNATSPEKALIFEYHNGGMLDFSDYYR
jgi:hypothetical protein